MARTFVWLLLLLNALYWSWAQGWLLPYGFGPTQQREPQRLARQIHPEAITLLSPAEMHLKAQPARSEPPLCLETGPMDEAQAEALRPYLEASWPAGSWVFQKVTVPERWLVYMGKYANLADLEKKRAELAGIQLDTQAVASAALSPGLSLGAYPTQAQATAALQALSRRGVRTARVVQEQAAVRGLRLRLPAVNEALEVLLPELRAVLPSGALESCPELETEP
jgi:hypothetical protein